MLTNFSCVWSRFEIFARFILPPANKEIAEKIYKSRRESTCVNNIRIRAINIQSSADFGRDETREWLRCVHETFAFIELRKLSVNIRWPIAVDSEECCDLICDSWQQRRSCHNIWVNADESESCGEENWNVRMQMLWMSPDNLCYMIIWVIHSAIHGFSTSRRISLNADLQQWNGFVDKRVRCAEILAQSQS